MSGIPLSLINTSKMSGVGDGERKDYFPSSYVLEASMERALERLTSMSQKTFYRFLFACSSPFAYLPLQPN